MWVVIVSGFIAFFIVWALFRFVTGRLAGGLIPTLLWLVPLGFFTPSGCHHDDGEKIKAALDDLKKQAEAPSVVP